MKNREIILHAVKRGLNKLAETDETYDEKMNGDEGNNENDIPTIPNSVQASKFLKEMCFVDDPDPNDPDKLSDENSKKIIIMALENFKNNLTDVGLFKELDQDDLVNIYQNCLCISSEKGREVILKRISKHFGNCP